MELSYYKKIYKIIVILKTSLESTSSILWSTPCILWKIKDIDISVVLCGDNESGGQLIPYSALPSR